MRTSKDIQKQIDDLAVKHASMTRHAKLHGEGQGEAEDFGGWTSKDDAKLTRLTAEHKEALYSEGGWNKETTAARRATWNARVTAGNLKTADQIKGLEKELGFSAENLRRAVKEHA